LQTNPVRGRTVTRYRIEHCCAILATPLSWTRRPLDRKLCAPIFRWVSPCWLSRRTPHGVSRNREPHRQMPAVMCNSHATFRKSLLDKESHRADGHRSEARDRASVGRSRQRASRPSYNAMIIGKKFSSLITDSGVVRAASPDTRARQGPGPR